jgi:ribosomal protein L40E
VTQEQRCSSCGALVSLDAEWCGQCYAPLRPVAAEEDRASGPAPALEVADGRPAWTCPACGTRNVIEASQCTACGTPFARLFEEAEQRPDVDPQTAAVWSLALPGLGHWRLGRKGDAVARSVVFAWAFGALVILLVSRFGKGGLGPTFPLFVVFLLGSASVYATSALDAYRIASGEQPLVSSRALLWGSVGLIVLSVFIATFVTLPAVRR